MPTRRHFYAITNLPKRPLPYIVLILLSLILARTGWAQDTDGRIHVVKEGETLLEISMRYGVPVRDLVISNNLHDQDLIYVNQRLIIPGLDADLVDLDGRDSWYQVQPDDSLRSIARRFGVTPAAILALNGLPSQKYLILRPPIRIPQNVVWPSPFVTVAASAAIIQGQTGVLDITLETQSTPQGTFDGQPIHFHYQGSSRDGFRYKALLPTGALSSPDDKSLQIRAADVELNLQIPIREGNYETQSIVLPPSKGELLNPRLTRNELELLQAIWSQESPRRLWRQAMAFPIPPGFQPTSPFGSRRSYNNGPVASFHAGTDWSAPTGTPISAPANGIIVLAEPLDVRGGAVVIDHGQGVFSNFWHLSQILVRPGQRVQRGDLVGEVGTTGLSTGAHLHWEMRVNGLAVDPMQWTQSHFPYLPVVPLQPKS